MSLLAVNAAAEVKGIQINPKLINQNPDPVEPGDNVKIIDGPFKDFDGRVSDTDKERGKIKVLINMFGRDTPVELDPLQIQKL